MGLIGLILIDQVLLQKNNTVLLKYSCDSSTWQCYTDSIGKYSILSDCQGDCKFAITYHIRDVGPAGGLIFYDKGSYSDGWRYLEAAPFDQGNGTWGCDGIAIPGADGTAIGTGRQNTLDMILAGCTNAAQLAHDIIINGYNDWFLPSKDELNQMYVNLKVYNVGDFTFFHYWSSSEFYANNVWRQSFYVGGQYYHYKDYKLYVRAIRAF